MNRRNFSAMIAAIVCAAVFPIVLFVVFLIEIGISKSLGFNPNPVAGIMFLSIAMTRTYPALILCTLVLGLPTVGTALNDGTLRSKTVVAVGVLASFLIAAGTMYSVGLLNISISLAAMNTFLLTAPLLLCFILFACWVRVMNGRSNSNNRS